MEDFCPIRFNVFNHRTLRMKKLWLVLVCTFSVGTLFAQGKIAPAVQASLQMGKLVDVPLIFDHSADISGAKNRLNKNEKASYVFTQLQQNAAIVHQNALRKLPAHDAQVQSLFLVNAIALHDADAPLLQILAALPEIRAIVADPWIHFDEPLPGPQSEYVAHERDEVAWGITKIQAPEVWNLGYTGQGISVGGADTGFDWTHPAIQSKYRGWTGDEASSQHDYHWHDAIHELNPLNNDTTGNPGTNPCGLDALVPCDDNRHGTHTMGTMTGNDGQGNVIGVAPGADWVGCRNMERGWGKPSSYLECFQWFLAPTDLGGMNPDPTRSPHVINNSWYCALEEGCVDTITHQLLRQAIINLRAAGVVVVVSNGNSGPNCNTTTEAAPYFEESFSVGATREDDFIAQFSSRGTVLVDGSNRMKPNVSAPGVLVRSCIPGGEYANFSGTSMAGPHVVGLVALMLSANPVLAGHVEDIEDIIEQTTVYFADTLDCGASLGTARPNHAYGWGRVDALGAVQAVLVWQPAVSTNNPILPQARVSPNPVQGEAIFAFENLSGSSVLEILDANGRRVVYQQWMASKRDTRRITLVHQAPGVYFWKLTSGNGVASGKILKM